jgi:exopolyphosphatase
MWVQSTTILLLYTCRYRVLGGFWVVGRLATRHSASTLTPTTFFTRTRDILLSFQGNSRSDMNHPMPILEEFPTVADFLKQTLVVGSTIDHHHHDEDPSSSTPIRVAIGNPAGDADSIISSIGSAYLDTVLKQRLTIPILSIPNAELQSLRPECHYLFSLAGVTIPPTSNTTSSSSSTTNPKEDTRIEMMRSIIDHFDELPDHAIVTLVDHNQLVALVSCNNNWNVETILDHHVDEGAHHDTCIERNIAFDPSSSQALVASTCTLIVERWQQHFLSSSTTGTTTTTTTTTNCLSPMPPTLAILLLGVILLDSINLLSSAGKATPRDEKAVHFLMETTDWSQLALPPELLWHPPPLPPRQDDAVALVDDGIPNDRPNPTMLFETLQNQKFQATFWNGLTALQALKLDYKSFTTTTTTTTTTTSTSSTGNDHLPHTFGISSVLQSMDEFLKKPNLFQCLVESYFPECDFVVVMFLTMDQQLQQEEGGGENTAPLPPRRQMLVISPDESLMEELVHYLETKAPLLQPLTAVMDRNYDSSSRLYWIPFEQGNIKASRKQVAPILMEFYNRKNHKNHNHYNKQSI